MPVRPSRPRIASAALLLALLAGCATAPRPALDGARPGPPPAPLPAAGGPLAPAPARPEPIRTAGRVTLAAVGDVLMHEAVKRSASTHGAAEAHGGYPWLYAPVADLLQEADLAFANLETPIAPDAGKGTREYVFNAPPEALRALRAAGIDVVSVANNHAFDQGRPGFEETLRRLAAEGILAAGAGPAGRAAGPLRVEANGLSLAFLAWAHFFNQAGNECPAKRAGDRECLQAALLDREAAVEAVREAAAGADAVVVSLHWGVEYEPQPRAEDVELARRLADAGALVVLGHHPHVLQPIELHRRPDGSTAVIAYSLGNFVSNQSRKYVHGVTPERVAATRDGALLRVSLARRDYGRGVVRVEVDGADFLPLWTENDTAEIDRKREPERKPAIRVVAVDRALAETRAALAAFPDPVPEARQAEFVALRRRESLLASRRGAISSLLGEELLRTLSPAELAPRPGAAVTPVAAP